VLSGAGALLSQNRLQIATAQLSARTPVVDTPATVGETHPNLWLIPDLIDPAIDERLDGCVLESVEDRSDFGVGEQLDLTATEGTERDAAVGLDPPEGASNAMGFPFRRTHLRRFTYAPSRNQALDVPRTIRHPKLMSLALFHSAHCASLATTVRCASRERSRCVGSAPRPIPGDRGPELAVSAGAGRSKLAAGSSSGYRDAVVAEHFEQQNQR